MNQAVASYCRLVDEVARRVEKTRRAQQVRAEYDDLFQEGQIAVWQALERGVKPSPLIVRQRMLGWIRLQACQMGLPCPRKKGAVETVPYEQLLPIEDFRATDVDPAWPGEA